jgi:hypothetical protein
MFRRVDMKWRLPVNQAGELIRPRVTRAITAARQERG